MKALILGASGLVGGKLLEKLLQEDRFSEVISFSRRPLSSHHPKLKQVISNLDDLSKYESEFQNADTLFCCLGTTIKKARSKEAFKKVDYDIPLEAAILFKKMQGKHFLIITAIGSDASSPFFYNKIKGQLENTLKELNINRLSIIRPSILLGKRDESRFFEDIGQKIIPLLNPIIPEKYQGVKAEDVAEVLLNTSLGKNCKYAIDVETV